jgi:hypothetical protein
MYLFDEDDNRWTWHSRDGICCQCIRCYPGCRLGSEHVHSGLRAGSSDIAHLQMSAVDRPKGSEGTGPGIPDGSTWPVHFSRGVLRALWRDTGGKCWRFFSPKKLGGAADVIGQGCRMCALACVTAKLFLPQPGGLRSPLVLSLTTPSHVVSSSPFYFNDHSVLLPLKTLHSHDLIGVSSPNPPRTTTSAALDLSLASPLQHHHRTSLR